jgi:hypothetical protein
VASLQFPAVFIGCLARTMLSNHAASGQDILNDLYLT